MLRIVLPAAVVSVAAVYVIAIAAVYVIVGVPDEVVVHIDIDVVVTPAAAPSATAPGCSHHHPHAEGNCRRGDISSHRRRRGIVDWRISIHRRPVYHGGVIAGYVHHFRARRLNHDDILVLNNCGFNLLLFVRREGALFLGFGAHTLNRIHHVALLRQESISQVRGPLDVVRQLFHQIGKHRHGLYARIPVLLHRGICQRLVLETFVLRQPLLELNDFERIGGGHQRLAEQRIGIKGDRRDKRVQFLWRECGC